MKKCILLLSFIPMSCFSQDDGQIFFEDFVECFYENMIPAPLIIYDDANGKPIDTLEALDENHCWYKLAISESKNGFLKIENIIAVPGCDSLSGMHTFIDLKGKWVSAKNMKIDIADLKVEKPLGVKFYTFPDLTSKVIYTSQTFLSTHLLEIDGLWAKVSFEVDGRRVEGWLQRADQCAYPWTSCPWSTE